MARFERSAERWLEDVSRRKEMHVVLLDDGAASSLSLFIEAREPTDELSSEAPRLRMLDHLPRGKAVTIMEQIASTPSVQGILQEISMCLLSAPKETLPISGIGNNLGTEARNFLHALKLRTAQLLRCFPEDFHIEDLGSASTATYKHAECKPYHVPPQQYRMIDIARYGRLMTLDTDITTHIHKSVKGISPIELVSEINKGRCLLIDCRSEEERSFGYLEGAVSLANVSMFEVDSCRVAVAYCCIGTCSAAWCQRLLDGTYTGAAGSLASKCVYVSGGVAAWAHYGGKFVQPQISVPIDSVHCSRAEFADFFPVRGYHVVCPEIGILRSLHSDTTVAQVSMIRFRRLQSLAREIHSLHFSSVPCLEVEAVMGITSPKEADIVLVDCRTEEERQISTLDAELPLLSKEQLKAHFFDLTSKPRTFVLFCTTGGRSGKFCAELLHKLSTGELSKQGPVEVKNMLGGVAAWLHGGGRLVDISRRNTRRVHTWVKPFMDLFPVGNFHLVCDELNEDVQDAHQCKSAS